MGHDTNHGRLWEQHHTNHIEPQIDIPHCLLETRIKPAVCEHARINNEPSTCAFPRHSDAST